MHWSGVGMVTYEQLSLIQSNRQIGKIFSSLALKDFLLENDIVTGYKMSVQAICSAELEEGLADASPSKALRFEHLDT